MLAEVLCDQMMRGDAERERRFCRGYGWVEFVQVIAAFISRFISRLVVNKADFGYCGCHKSVPHIVLLSFAGPLLYFVPSVNRRGPGRLAFS